MSIAKTVLHKFVGYLEAQASELIWKPRCSATIAWEQSQGISAKDKTSKYTGPRGDWSQGYGYITHDGFSLETLPSTQRGIGFMVDSTDYARIGEAKEALWGGFAA
ncbi:hypothetical protein KI688_002347 [Linnemannia hyalina]|uniref:Uncharacterized protein n=1 Tax=Linnemannia hyalina TaxID=64524 RepID=A0A9P7XQ37_9FUNG|nr:hypothetical protein KI688_002347 [Linnemannia hyalina]